MISRPCIFRICVKRLLHALDVRKHNVSTTPAGVYKDAYDFAEAPEDVADVGLEGVGGRLPTAIVVEKETASVFSSVVALSKFSFCSLWSWSVDGDGGSDCSVIGVYVVGGRRLGRTVGRKMRGRSVRLHVRGHVDERLA